MWSAGLLSRPHLQAHPRKQQVIDSTRAMAGNTRIEKKNSNEFNRELLLSVGIIDVSGDDRRCFFCSYPAALP